MKNNRFYFEDRVIKGFGFHYSSELQNKYAHEIRKESIDIVVNEIFSFTGKSILDVGCGDGNWMQIYLKEYFAKEVVGIEQSFVLCKSANNRFKEKKENAVCYPFGIGDRFYDTFDALKKRFDMATFITVFNFIEPKRRRIALNQVRKMLKERGYILLLDYFPTTVPEHQKGLSYKEVWTYDETVKFLEENGFEAKKGIAVNYIDSLFFHYFGVNLITYYITSFLESIMAWLPINHEKLSKYKIILAIKK